MNGAPASGTIRTSLTEGTTGHTTELIAELAQSSVEISLNAKGATQFSVKVYSNDPGDARQKAQDIYEQLSAKYNKE